MVYIYEGVYIFLKANLINNDLKKFYLEMSRDLKCASIGPFFKLQICLIYLILIYCNINLVLFIVMILIRCKNYWF